jgi:two-component system response regulator
MLERKLLEILLVEDDGADAELAMRGLKSHMFNEVHWVKDGLEAVDFIFRRGRFASRPDKQPDLVLLDLNLPKLDGLSVLRAIRGHEETRDIPVVVLTGSASENDMVHSYGLHINNYLVKPIQFEDFAAVVAHAGFRWGLFSEAPA